MLISWRSERFPITVLYFFLAISMILLTSCSGGGGGTGGGSGSSSDNAKLSGTWITPSQGGTYITMDGAGTITDLGMFSPQTPYGAYLVTNNTFSITFYGHGSPEGDVQVNGNLVTSSTASATAVQGPASFTTDIFKVTDPGACQGTWTGTFTKTGSILKPGLRKSEWGTDTYTIYLTVDASGSIITGGTISPGPYGITGGKLYSESGYAMGMIKTDMTGTYDQIQIQASGNGAAIVGTYVTPNGTAGTIKLVNTANNRTPLNNSKLFGPWLIDAGTHGPYYLVSDGTGSITDLMGFKPGGSYKTYEDNTLTMTIGNPAMLGTGRLTSATRGSFETEEGTAGSLIKVDDPGACQGNWIGTLTDLKSDLTSTIDLTVDGSGIITGGTLTAGSDTYTIKPSETRLYCQSGLAAGGLLTAPSVTISYIQIMGNGNETAIVGNYTTDPSNGITGLIHLVKTVTPLADNSKFSGPWLIPYYTGALYLDADGAGLIDEFSVPGFGSPAGTYSAYTDNSLVLAIIAGSDTVAYVTGELASDGTTASVRLTETETALSHTMNMNKVADPGACQGTWTGTLTEANSGPTYTISLTVDTSGVISGGTLTTDAGYTIDNSGHLYCQSGLAAGLLATNATGTYSQVQIIGSGNVNAITGSYAVPGAQPGTQAGSISLVNTTHDSNKNNALLANMAWLLPTDPYKTIYFTTDGAGTASIEDVISGSYSAYQDNTIIVTFQPDPITSVFMTGQLTSGGTMASLVLTETGSTTLNTGTLLKVSNRGACQGHWTGTLRTTGFSLPIDLTVDGSGIITAGYLIEGVTKLNLAPGKKLYCESGHVGGLLQGAAENPFILLLSGSLYGTTISGTLMEGGASLPLGSVVLTKH
jgi:hypothetical protein